MSFPVRLDVFEGPLDLLLQLVSKDRLSVLDVSVAVITDEYLAAVRAMDELDLEAATSFLVLAATLLELKSVKLLPRRDADDPDLAVLLEERDRLLHRLVELATFKQAGEAIARGLEDNRGFFSRRGGAPEELVQSVPDPLEAIAPGDLLRAALAALRPKETPVDISFVAPIRVSLEQAIDMLVAEMTSRRTTSFRALCDGAEARIEVIVCFLGVLELLKRNLVSAEQDRPFGEIVLRWRSPAAPSEAPVEGAA